MLEENARQKATTKKRKDHVNREISTLTAEQRKITMEERAMDMQRQQEKSKLLVNRKKRLQQLARDLINNGNITKCTSLLMESETRAARCVQLMSQIQDVEKKCAAAEEELDMIKRTRADTALDDCILRSTISQDAHDKLLEFVKTVTKRECTNVSRKDALDEGFHTESWYDFDSTEAQVCTHTHLVGLSL